MAAVSPPSKRPKMSSTSDADDNPAVSGESRRKYKRRKVALFLAYCGFGYQGMQRNPGARTIEGDLQDALLQAQAIPPSDHAFPQRYDWARAARTDKGVSAAFQVVSGRFTVDPPGFVDRLNARLPQQIRVFGYKRVTGSFNAKKLCDRRRYVYLLPVFALDPSSHPVREAVMASLESGNEIGRCLECSERGRKVPGLMGRSGERRVCGGGRGGGGVSAEVDADRDGPTVVVDVTDEFAECGCEEKRNGIADTDEFVSDDIREVEAESEVAGDELVGGGCHGKERNVVCEEHCNGGGKGNGDVEMENEVVSANIREVEAESEVAGDELVGGGFRGKERNVVCEGYCNGGGKGDGEVGAESEVVAADIRDVKTESEVVPVELGVGGCEEKRNGVAVDGKGDGEVGEESEVVSANVGEGGDGDDNEKTVHSGFRYGDEERERFNRILNRYVGTHNFHNFTTRIKAEDPSARRYILSFEANRVVTLDGIDFVRCEVVGQSFMLHQIRKMIGLAVAIIRNCAPESIMDVALRKDVRVNVPTAPEVGLYLDECFFTSYNKKWKDSHEPVTAELYEEEAEKFRLTYILPHIAAMERKEGSFALFLHSLNSRNYPDFNFMETNGKDIDAPKAQMGAEGEQLKNREDMDEPNTQISNEGEQLMDRKDLGEPKAQISDEGEQLKGRKDVDEPTNVIGGEGQKLMNG